VRRRDPRVADFGVDAGKATDRTPQREAAENALDSVSQRGLTNKLTGAEASELNWRLGGTR
jgi:hypothetical protein